MIRMSYAQARNLAQNTELLTKLFHTQMPIKTARKMKRILERVGLAAKYVDEQQYTLQMEAAKKYGVLDEKGEPKTDEKGELEFLDSDSRGNANKHVMVALAPVLKRELVLVLDPISFDDTKLELTLAEVDLLGPMLVQEEETNQSDGDPSSEKEPA